MNFMKKVFSLILVFFILFAQPTFASIKGHIEHTDENEIQLDKELFTGEVEVLKEDKTVEVTVSQVLSSGYTQAGDEFFAEISQDIYGDKGMIIPVGSVAHGVVNTIVEPKNMGRDGWVILDFDYLVTPDGRQIPIKGSITTKDSKPKAIVKGVAEHTGYTLAGGLVGGFFALNFLGLEAAIASQGYTIAGGAAIGGAIGLVQAIRRKGDGVLIKPGDQIKVKMLSNIELPVFQEDAFKQEEVILEGLDVVINDIKYEKDPFGVENTITLKLLIKNNTRKKFSTFDMCLVSDVNNVFHPSPFGRDDSLWFRDIKPGEVAIGNLSFSVHDIKRKHWLVFNEGITRKPVAKISIDNAKKELSKKKKRKWLR
ncbi:MAG: TrbI/VirB10 family protein [Cyanobacteria bacterium SIG30]|nr:TrbI/VirB10 family protein [Cyanobacteria bacterium SIG30]